MWHMSSGDRVLDANEAKLVMHAASRTGDELSEEAESGIQSECQIPIFDDLPWQIRLKLLAEVVHALVDPDVPPPELTAFNEAAVAAIFYQAGTFLTMEIESEIDEQEGESFDWRKLVFACHEPMPAEDVDDDYEQLMLESDDIDRWHRQVELIRDRILWDEDFLMYDPRSPKTVTLPDIEPDYFSDSPKMPSDDDVDELWGLLWDATHPSTGPSSNGGLRGWRGVKCPKCGHRAAAMAFQDERELRLVVDEGVSEKVHLPFTTGMLCRNPECEHRFRMSQI